MKLVFCFVVALVAQVSSALETWRDPTTDIVWVYTLSNGTVTLGSGGTDWQATTSYSLESVTVPQSINGRPVKSISNYAFYRMRYLQAVSIPSSITNIGAYAFASCSALASVSGMLGVKTIGPHAFDGCTALSNLSLPLGLTIIDEYAFANCRSLPSIDIPASVEVVGSRAFDRCSKLNNVKIGYGLVQIGYGTFYAGVKHLGALAFYFCTQLERIEIPSSVLTIGVGCFSECANLSEICVLEGNPNFCSQDGMLYNKDRSEILRCPCRTERNEIKLPPGIVTIGQEAFSGCADIRSVGIPNGVVTIGDSAFSDCKAIREIDIPEGVETIGSFAFSGCSLLETVRLPETLKTIGGYEYLHGSVFSFCKNLTMIEIPKGVEFICYDCFYGCSSLSTVTISANTYFPPGEAGPFADCRSIRTVYYDDWNARDRLRKDMRLKDDAVMICTNPPMPVFVEEDGTIFDSVLKVAITNPASDAVIHYTTDGTSPTTESAVFSKFSITKKTTIKAIAELDGYCSEVVTATYGKGRVSTPTITSSQGDRFHFSGNTIVVDCATEGVEIHYTLDGSIPSELSPLYDHPIVIDETTVVRAVAMGHVEWLNSDMAEAPFVREWLITPSPTSNPADGAVFYHRGEWVTLQVDGADAIFYTVDGSEPTRDSLRYEVPFRVDDSITIKMIAVKDDHKDSEVAVVRLLREWEAVDTPCIKLVKRVGSVEDTTALMGSFLWVEMNCSTEGAAIHYTMDGSAPTVTSPVYEKPFKVTDSAAIKAIAVKDDWRDSSVASATVTKKWTDGDSLNSPDMTFGGDGTEAWTTDTTVSHDGVASMKSGEIGNDQTSIIQTVVNGSGKVIFWWRASCEQTDMPPYWWDYGAFMIGSEEVAWIDGTTDWRRCEIRIEGAGDHVLKWKYEKDGSDREGADCIWLDQFIWIPDVGNATTKKGSVEVPHKWLDDYGLLVEYDPEVVVFHETGKTDGTGKALTVADEFVAGTNPNDPESKFSVKIEVVDGKPVVTWEPALNGEGVKTGVRTYTIQGSNDLKSWSVVPDGKESEYHYFKVGVGMP